VRRFFEAVRRPLKPFDVKLVAPKRRLSRETHAIPAELMHDVLLACPPRKRMLFHLLWTTGLRIGEALSLRKRDVDLGSSPPKLKVVSEKTNRPRVVFLPEDLAAKLRELAGLDDDAFIFHVECNAQRPLNLNKIGETFRRILLKVDKLKKDMSGRGYVYTLHSFRRAYETTLATCGVHPMTIKFLLGRSQGVEDSYLRLAEGDLANEWRKAENALRLDIKQPVDRDYMKQLEGKLTKPQGAGG